MKLRDLGLAVCLFGCQIWGTSLAQQVSAAPGVAAPPEPHPAPATAPAGPTVYNVELIIFRASSTIGSPENWAAEAAQAPAAPTGGEGEGAAPLNDAPVAAPAGQVPSARFVRALAPTELQLGDIEARIKSSGAYALITHVGWAQSASPWGSRASMSLPQLGVEVPGMTGTITLERGQYLHLGMALNLTVANPPATLGAPPQTTFVLNDSHRVKFYERNYYDSPAFGVIALVVPAQGTRRPGR